jgi:hypothetical protein
MFAGEKALWRRLPLRAELRTRRRGIIHTPPAPPAPPDVRGLAVASAPRLVEFKQVAVGGQGLGVVWPRGAVVGAGGEHMLLTV